MVKFYVCQIRLGKLQLSDVPAKWHDAVAKALEEDETAE